MSNRTQWDSTFAPYDDPMSTQSYEEFCQLRADGLCDDGSTDFDKMFEEWNDHEVKAYKIPEPELITKPHRLGITEHSYIDTYDYICGNCGSYKTIDLNSDNKYEARCRCADNCYKFQRNYIIIKDSKQEVLDRLQEIGYTLLTAELKETLKNDFKKRKENR